MTALHDALMARTAKDANGCWLWTGHRDRHGYSSFTYRKRTRYGHRWSYELYVSPVPDGLEIDHTCRVRHCINPEHLETVTHAENNRRAAVTITHCPHGHEYDERNTSYINGGRKRRCLTCHRLDSRRRYQPVQAVQTTVLKLEEAKPPAADAPASPLPKAS